MDTFGFRLVPEPRQSLSPRLIQFQKLLQKTTLELIEELKEQLEKNLVLEEVSPEEDEDESDLSEATSEMELWEDYDDFYYRPMHPDEEHLEPTAVTPPSLREDLLTQLRISTADPTGLTIGEFVIGSLDERGYIPCTVEELVEDLNADRNGEAPVTHKMVESIVELIQTFEPLGIGARNDRECLLIQARAKLSEGNVALKILEDHLEELETRDYLTIAQQLKVSERTVLKAARFIKTLQPHPGLAYDQKKLEYVVPDIVVAERDGEWICMLNESDLPRLRISAVYQDIIRNSKTSPKEEKVFVSRAYRRARWLLGNLHQRRATVLKITRFVTNFQTEFLQNGGESLKPMTMALIAQHVNVHESTVSRAVKGKYVKTPVGTFPFRDWIVNSCNHAVKLRIKELIDAEDKSKPLTDDRISVILSEEGHTLQRRTVAKYRKKLNIPSARARKHQ